MRDHHLSLELEFLAALLSRCSVLTRLFLRGCRLRGRRFFNVVQPRYWREPRIRLR